MTPLDELYTVDDCEEELMFLTDQLMEMREHADEVKNKLEELKKVI